MPSRTYAQFCGVAAAMDVLGQRWAVLIIRDLVGGPRRYTDLLRTLPGMSTDMLAARLSELEQAGVVQRSVLPPPASAKVYELTEFGRQLEPVLDGLARWGLRRLAQPDYADAAVDPAWIEFALRAVFDPTRAPRGRVRMRFTIDGHEIVVEVGPDGIEMQDPSTDGTDVHVTGSTQALVQMLIDPAQSSELLERGDVTIAGDKKRVADALDAFHPVARGLTNRDGLLKSKSSIGI